MNNLDDCHFGTSPVSDSYFKCTKGMSDDEKLRDLLLQTARQFTAEEMKEIEQNAVWFELTDDGIKMSRGMSEFLTKSFKGINEKETNR